VEREAFGWGPRRDNSSWRITCLCLPTNHQAFRSKAKKYCQRTSWSTILGNITITYQPLLLILKSETCLGRVVDEHKDLTGLEANTHQITGQKLGGSYELEPTVHRYSIPYLKVAECCRESGKYKNKWWVNRCCSEGLKYDTELNQNSKHIHIADSIKQIYEISFLLILPYYAHGLSWLLVLFRLYIAWGPLLIIF